MYAPITKGKYQHIEVSLVLQIAISKTLAELSVTSSVGFLTFDIS